MTSLSDASPSDARTPVAKTGHDVFLVQPVVRGVHPYTMWNIHNVRTVLGRNGHRLHGAPTYRVPLDHARNELATIFLSTTADICWTQDDDVQLDEEDAMLLIDALDAGCDIVAGPCRMRSEGHMFNVIPITEPVMLTPPAGRSVRVCEVAWSGFGCVMFKRHVFERLQEDAEGRSKKPPCPTCGHHDLQVYRSSAMPGRNTAATFRSEIVAAKELFPDAEPGHNVYLLDDRVFCRKVQRLGFKIHAAVDAHTDHDGLRGCFAEDLEKFARSQARGKTKARGLLGPDGRPVK
jgi:hypothetical protein